jgi:molybdate transport system substrate-binding protein
MKRALLAVLLLAALPVRAADPGLVVFAAASLTDVMQDISALWQAQGHARLKLSFASSSMLARQIEAGAPASLFASADTQWADYLDQRHLLADGTRHDLLGNALVLIVPADRRRSLSIDRSLDLPALLGPGGRLAVGDPAHVPAGIYARQALASLGLWDSVRQHLAPTEDVRTAMLLVERGEAPAGIVYATDAAADPGVAVAGTFPADSHPPIIYPFAVVRSGDTPEARALMDFLQTAPAQAAFRRRGFSTEAVDSKR